MSICGAEARCRRANADADAVTIEFNLFNILCCAILFSVVLSNVFHFCTAHFCPRPPRQRGEPGPAATSLRGFYERVHESFTRVLRARSREFYEGFKSVFTSVLRGFCERFTRVLGGFCERVHESFTRVLRACSREFYEGLTSAFTSVLQGVYDTWSGLGCVHVSPSIPPSIPPSPPS